MVYLSSTFRRHSWNGPPRWLGRLSALAWMVAACLFVPAGDLEAQVIEQDQLVGPFVDGDPFDVIYLNEDGDDAIMKVQPLGDKIPDSFTDQGQLTFWFFEEGEDRYEVPYSSIESIKTFHDFLLEEARTWIEEEDYAKAFRNLLYIYDHGGKNDSELVKELNTCMFQDGRENFENKEFELALSIFEDIYESDPNFKLTVLGDRKLVDVVMACYDGIIAKQFNNSDYIGVRRTLDSVVKKYQDTDTADALNEKWKAAFRQRSDKLMDDARQFATAGKGREAHLAARQADQMFPGREEVLDLQKDILLQFPMIIVGVSQSSEHPDPNEITNWASRRDGRLTQRQIIELNGLTDEGGKYEFPNGRMYQADDVGLKYTFELKDDVTGFAVPPATAFQISFRMLKLADPASASYNEAWAKIAGPVSIDDERHVSVMLRTPHVRPEAVLKTAYSDPDENGVPDQDGPYVEVSRNNDIVTFERNTRYAPQPERQYPVLVEQIFPAASSAVDELIAGNIDVVDRIPISDIQRLKAAPGIEIRPYVIPSVHMLVPKIRGEMANDSNFRNGLSHSIDRDLLVRDVISGGQAVDGCEIVSGPFPIGTEENDQISYGYDLRVRPLPHNSMLGAVMIDLALRAIPPTRPEPIPAPNLVLAHPASSTAASAAASIARMWEEVGIKTETRALKPGETIPPDDNWDFLYLEATVEEPLADASKLLGPRGIAKDVSAPVEQTLRILSYSKTWQSACSALRRLHRQTSVDLSIIPLWQVKEHYAFRSVVRGIGRDLIHLYQNVDRWKIDLTADLEPEK